VPVVDPTDGAVCVVQNLVLNETVEPQLAESGSGRSAEVMRRPGLDPEVRHVDAAGVDARTGRPRGELLTGHTDRVKTVALGKVEGGDPVVVSGGADKTVRLWDVRTGRPRREPLTGHTDTVFAVALGEVDGEPVVVSFGDDDHVRLCTMRLWDAHTGRPRGGPLTGPLAAESYGEDAVVALGEASRWLSRAGVRTPCCGMLAPACPAASS
jgi:WD40 domain-containing protein